MKQDKTMRHLDFRGTLKGDHCNYSYVKKICILEKMLLFTKFLFLNCKVIHTHTPFNNYNGGRITYKFIQDIGHLY